MISEEINSKQPIMVSICCQTFNHYNYIKEALDSFLMQETDFEFEILLRDDASTDGTAETCIEYAEKYPDIIKPLFYKENQLGNGVKPFRDNVKRAQGKYIAICEGDDYWTDPNKLQKQVDYLEENENYGGCFHITERLNVVTRFTSLFNPPFNIISTRDLIRHGGGGIIDTCSLLFRKEILHRSASWYDFMPFDQTLNLLISLSGPIGKINSVMAVYRTNQTNSWTSAQSKDLNKRLKFDLSEMRMWMIFYKTEDIRFKFLVIRAILKVVYRYAYNLFLFALKSFLGEKYEIFYNRVKRL